MTESAGGQTQRYTYLNTGLAASISTGTGTGGGYVEAQHSDFTYYASGDKFTEVSTIGGVTVQNATATYDARGRMLSWIETGNATNPYATISWTYDAAGNIRHETSTFTPLSATGGTLSSVTQSNWFRYDSMNHVVTANGIVVGGQIVRGYTGTDITYNLAGDRTTVTNTVTSVGKVRREDYSYYTSGNLSQVAVAEAVYTDNYNGTVTVSLPGTGDIKASYTYDAMSRLTRQQDWTGNGSGVAVDRQVTYNAAGQISVDNVSQKQGSDIFGSVTTNSYGSGSGYALGAVVSSSTTNTKNGTSQPTSSTSNSFVWYDGALLSVISYKPDVTQSATNTTTNSYNGAGVFISASIADGRPRTVTATNDALGQVIRRDESNGNPSTGFPHEVWYRFNGRELGHVSNNGTLETDYRTSIDQRTAASAGTGNFRNGASTGATAAEFGSGYDPFTSYEQASGLGTYTVRSGDTLVSIAAQAWGDASLWYKLASANGLSASSMLAAGQTLVLPAGVTRTTNTASTFKPYDPAEAVGDTSPTTPKPQAKKNKCGVFGQILLMAISIAVAVVLPHVAAVFQGFWGGVLAAVAGNVVSQGVGLATGIQQKFDFKGLAMAAVGSMVGGALKGANVFKAGSLGGATNFANDLVRGALSSTLTQGIGVATGLQPKFDFVGVAAAGVGAAVGGAANRGLKFDGKLQGFDLGNSLRGLGGNVAGDIASAATRSVLEGSSFGDNLLQALPDSVAQFAGSLVGGALSEPLIEQQAKQYAENVGGGDSVRQSFEEMIRSGASNKELDAAAEQYLESQRAAVAARAAVRLGDGDGRFNTTSRASGMNLLWQPGIGGGLGFEPVGYSPQDPDIPTPDLLHVLWDGIGSLWNRTVGAWWSDNVSDPIANAIKGWNILWSQATTPVDAGYVLAHPEIFTGQVITRSLSFDGITGVIEGGEFVSDHATGNYIVIGMKSPSIDDIRNIERRVTVAGVFRGGARRFSGAIGVYKNLNLFSGSSMNYGGSLYGVSYIDTYSIAPNGTQTYSGRSAGVGWPSRTPVPNVSGTYTILLNVRRR